VTSPLRHAPRFALLAALAALAALATANASCSKLYDPQDPATTSMPKGVGLLVVESDFGGTSYVEAIDTETHAIVGKGGLFVDADPLLRRLVDPAGTEHLFIVGRKNGKLTEIDRAGAPLRTISVVDDGLDATSANPYDVAIAPDGKLWVTRYNQPTLLVLNADGTRAGTVDLSTLADPDGRPEMAAIAIVGGIAYVALDRLSPSVGGSDPAPTDYSSIVSIDTTSQPWTAKLFQKLPVPTPRERFRHAQFGPATDLWISCLGAPRSVPPSPGALIKIDLTGKNDPKVVLDGTQLMLDGKATRGFVNGYDVYDDERGWAVIASIESTDNPTSVVEFNPTTGQIVSNVWYGRGTFDLWDIALADDRLLVLDRNRQDPAIVVLDASDGSLIEPRITTRLAAVELVILRSQP
jgi:hypothetical protein